MLQLVFSIAGVLVFTGLTAWDTQRLKSEYLDYAGTARADKLAVMGALSLYLNLINLFQLLLSLFGQREERRRRPSYDEHIGHEIGKASCRERECQYVSI